MRKIKTIRDVIDWRLCTGCGICSYICGSDVIEMRNIESVGIRPFILDEAKVKNEECLAVCPGFSVTSSSSDGHKESLLIGPLISVSEGSAADEKLRLSASSGGALSALALYCIEKENMSIVLHTGMDSEIPWGNTTVISRTREELFLHTGSRYAPSSPCDGIEEIKKSDGKSVFIGKPCDVAAINMLRKRDPELDSKLGLVLSFFCAGVPSSDGVFEVLKELNIDKNAVESLRYRGDGWPGNFTVKLKDGSFCDTKTYENSWGILSKYRSIRCQLCPDGLGELSDITCGDAWHRIEDENQSGLSLIIVRSEHGATILEKAKRGGYINIKKSSREKVIEAQGLVKRRKELFGRILAFKLLFIPVTDYKGFKLFEVWKINSPIIKIRSVFGTYKRIFMRHYWMKKK